MAAKSLFIWKACSGNTVRRCFSNATTVALQFLRHGLMTLIARWQKGVQKRRD